MIKKGFFSTVNELLARPYELRLENVETGTSGESGLGDLFDDVATVSFGSTCTSGEKQTLMFSRKNINQVLPATGIYHCRNKNDDDVRLEITADSVIVYDVKGPEDLALRFSS